jgi:hypothetical protein
MFVKGQSGNPAGCPKFSRSGPAKLSTLISEIEDQQVNEMAKVMDAYGYASIDSEQEPGSASDASKPADNAGSERNDPQ